MIPAYSPQARGRSERSFGTWQGRLPQELRLARCGTLEQANEFLREHYVAEFNRRFQVAALQRGNAFVPCRSRDLALVFSVQSERAVNRDNTVSFQNHALQLERVGRFNAQGEALTQAIAPAQRAVEKTRGGKVKKPTFPPRLEIPQSARDSHFPTAPATAG
jgi:hypothetical protein